MPTGYHHVTFNVTDLDRARAFYEGILRFTVDQDFPGEKLRFRFGEGNQARLALRPPLPGTPAGDQFTERRIGLDHLSVGVASRAELDQLTEALRRAGVTVGLSHDALGPAVVSFRDPDNIQWEFFEQR
jgi:glyoxylase I family protein